MTSTAYRGVVRRLRAAARPPAAGATDAELLARFVRAADAEAFAELVRRHGPMVYGVCRRVLGHAQDAEDAAQAALLVLARKAPAVRPRGRVGAWLYGVAYRVAAHARGRRKPPPRELTDVPTREAAPAADPALLAALDDELAALPEKLRAAVVACELEGRTIRDAAAALGVPPGTVASRLARGRALLADRLRKRGLAVTAAAVSAALASPASARLPAGLADGLAEPTRSALELADGVTKMMLVSKLKGVGRAAVLGVMVAAGLAAGFDPGPAAAPALRPAAAPAPPPKAGAVPGVERRKLDALWDDLLKDDKTATRAVLALSARPREAVPFLREKLKPLTLTRERAAKLVADLGSEDEKAWKPAFEEMLYFDPRLAIDLQTLMGEAKDDLTRQRLTAALAGSRSAGYFAWCDIEIFSAGGDNLNFKIVIRPNAPPDLPEDTHAGKYKPAPGAVGPGAGSVSMWAEHKVGRITRPSWTRAVRAAVLLEHLGTPEAVAVLQVMAGGHPDAGPTKAAKEALDRLGASK